MCTYGFQKLLSVKSGKIQGVPFKTQTYETMSTTRNAGYTLITKYAKMGAENESV